MITKVWVIVDAQRGYNGSPILEYGHFYLSPLAAELVINDMCMNGFWEVKELTLGERS
jgi:hypothetical protein